MASDDTSPGLSPKPQSPEKPKGVSRKKKSASQTEVLERAYACKICYICPIILRVPLDESLRFGSYVGLMLIFYDLKSLGFCQLCDLEAPASKILNVESNLTENIHDLR